MRIPHIRQQFQGAALALGLAATATGCKDSQAPAQQPQGQPTTPVQQAHQEPQTPNDKLTDGQRDGLRAVLKESRQRYHKNNNKPTPGIPGHKTIKDIEKLGTEGEEATRRALETRVETFGQDKKNQDPDGIIWSIN